MNHMTNRRKRKTKVLPLKIGNDPNLWRYHSAQDAISQNVPLLAELILSSVLIETEDQAANTDDSAREA
jgi:hypothetical protein